jgi:hypothetical protein
MKWRCPECGKPHERNDPPCDNCGHHKFERAVVPVAEGEGDHETYVWVCTECGREHQRNSPPCSRCGNHDLERREQVFDAAELETRSYLELVGRFELAAAAALVVLLAVIGLGATGVIALPGFGPPTVADVPGNATGVDGVAFDDVESELATIYAADRSGSLAVDSDLDAMVTYYNQRRVKAAVGDGTVPDLNETARQFDLSCEGPLSVYAYRPIPTGEAGVQLQESDAAAVASDIATVTQAQRTTPPQGTAVGIDVHVVGDTLYVTEAYC